MDGVDVFLLKNYDEMTKRLSANQVVKFKVRSATDSTERAP